MTRKILAFGASNSKNSINKKLATFAAGEVKNSEVDLVDLNDFEMPLYSIDRQKSDGIPQLAYDFLTRIKSADGLVISLAEHNGAYTVAFKNIFDWVSRIEKNLWNNKPMLLLSTSDGAGGARIVLDIAYKKFSRLSENEVISFSLPNFNDTFSEEKGIVDDALNKKFREQVQRFEDLL